MNSCHRLKPKKTKVRNRPKLAEERKKKTLPHRAYTTNFFSCPIYSNAQNFFNQTLLLLDQLDDQFRQ